MKLAHFYHVYAAGQWAESVTEHVAALHASGLLDALPDGVQLGLVGPSDACDMVRLILTQSGVPHRTVAQAETGWEHVTLEALHAAAKADTDGYTLYCHTKGSANHSELQETWRGAMTRVCVTEWRDTLTLLDETGADAAGAHWLDDQGADTDPSYFGGNFWWARNDYLAANHPLTYENRYHAEIWIGWNQPTVVDLLPGHPRMHAPGYVA